MRHYQINYSYTEGEMMGFELGNWNVEFNNIGCGFVQNWNDDRTGFYAVDMDETEEITVNNLVFTDDKGNRENAPEIPNYLKERIASLEKRRLRELNKKQKVK